MATIFSLFCSKTRMTSPTLFCSTPSGLMMVSVRVIAKIFSVLMNLIQIRRPDRLPASHVRKPLGHSPADFRRAFHHGDTRRFHCRHFLSCGALAAADD